eukprot:SAG31_NODE_27118_length_431_cov_0.771084_1_plen_33_part_10
MIRVDASQSRMSRAAQVDPASIELMPCMIEKRV